MACTGAARWFWYNDKHMHEEFTITQDEIEKGKGPGRPPRPKRSWPHWRRAFKWLGFFILFAIIAAAIFLYINVAKISVNPFGFGKLKGESTGRVNILMLGVGDPGHDGQDLSDTDIVLSVNTVNHQIAIISVPRDTRVKIPGYGSGKINSANEDGGVPLAEQVFSQTLGIPIDYYVKANFTGLSQVVDAVGGVDVTNTTLLSDPEYPCDNNQYKSCGYRLTPGQYHLNGAAALKYVRCRKGTCGNDFGRAARQQQVMESIRQRATSAGTLANPIKLTKLVSAAGSNLHTDLSVNNLMRLEQLTKGTTQTNIYNIVFNLNPDGFLVASGNSSDLLPADGTFADIQVFVQNIFKYGPIWTEHPTVAIQNGTTTAGLGSKFSQKLLNDGYDISVESVTDALTQDHTTSQIIDYTGGKRPHTVGYLEGLLHVKQVTPPPAPTAHPPADIVVIIGSDYAASATSGGSASSSPASGTGGSSSQ